ncbi:unnamed protein product [Amoebophrya sp. A25]|nr:unnamed protein product [Amoebophrya sp. A25]|eukprot:GSA25T00013625001.1
MGRNSAYGPNVVQALSESHRPATCANSGFGQTSCTRDGARGRSFSPLPPHAPLAGLKEENGYHAQDRFRSPLPPHSGSMLHFGSESDLERDESLALCSRGTEHEQKLYM